MTLWAFAHWHVDDDPLLHSIAAAARPSITSLPELGGLPPEEELATAVEALRWAFWRCLPSGCPRLEAMSENGDGEDAVCIALMAHVIWLDAAWSRDTVREVALNAMAQHDTLWAALAST